MIKKFACKSVFHWSFYELKKLFNGNNYRFCSHNDISINCLVGWHKDKLNDIYSSYETYNIWSEYNSQKHEIVKVLIYLQEESNFTFNLTLFILKF